MTEVSSAIQKKIDPVELATTILPRMEHALQLATTPEDTNEIRAQIETAATYIRRHIPRVISDRRDQFKYTHESDMLYLRASEKAGALWHVCDNRRPHGGDRRSDQVENFQLETISAVDAGFKNPRDAVTCERISELDEEDWRTYETETLTDMRQPTLHGLENIWRLLQPSDQIPPPEGKYRIIYADPPWKYQEHGVSVDPSYGEVRYHYNPLTIEQMCELPIKSLAEDDAVLFIWVTSPKLNQVWDVIEAWGFEYKTSFVWDKVKHNFGYYNSVRHELLLVCGRGSCTPDVAKLFDSVQSIERSDEHSEKPEEFRKIIDTLYTHGKRIELFARKQIEGWDSWGSES